MKQLLPILKPAGYQKDEPLFFKESLFNNSDSPVIAFGTDEGNLISYEYAKSEEEYQNKFQSLKEQAIENLKSIQPEIEIQNAEGAKFVFVVGHEYACEKILDKDFMIGLSNQLDVSSIMVGVPFKGCLIATDSNSEIRLKFPAIIKKYFENPQQPPISPHVFIVQNGEIVMMAGENINDELTDGNFKIIEKGGTNNYNVDVSCSTIDELTNTVNLSFQQIMLMVMNRKAFGGEISYRLSTSIPLTNQLIEKCNSYAEQIEKNEMAQTLTQALTKSSIKLLFFYDGKQIAPQTTEKPGNDIDYTNFSEQELTNEFYQILEIPNARTNIEALTKMSALMKEFERRGLQLPDPNSRPSDNSKKWWQFWK